MERYFIDESGVPAVLYILLPTGRVVRATELARPEEIEKEIAAPPSGTGRAPDMEDEEEDDEGGVPLFAGMVSEKPEKRSGGFNSFQKSGGGKSEKAKVLLKEGKLSVKEIAEQVGSTTNYIYVLKAKMKKDGDLSSAPAKKEAERESSSEEVVLDLTDPDADTDPLEPGQEEELVVDIRRLWIVQKLNPLVVMRELNITMRRFSYLTQKYGLKRE